MHNSTFRSSITTCIFMVAFFLLSISSFGQVKKVFTPRYDETIKGDVTIIANNMLSAHPTNNFNGTGDNQDNNNRVYVDIDSDPSTFNSSSATLNDPNPGLNCKEFVKAYLYWAASDKEAGGVSQNADSWNHNQVKLMLPGASTYTTITADEVLYRGRNEHFHNDPYICVKDITSDVVGLSDPFGKYQVGNVQATYGGLQPHGGGNYGVAGGWQIVFVYQSTELLTRNITLFDGYAHVDNGATTDFNVDGFLSIPSGPVKADIILGTIEGDRVLSGDSFQIKKPDGNWQKISTPLRGQDNFFSSTISIDGAHFIDRVPASTNTLGYDASIFELSNPGNSLIANNQTSTTLRATSGQESYGLYLVGFSIEVYEPSLGALEFTTSPSGTSYDPGETATLTMSIENSGNDNIRNLEISTVLPIEVNFNSTEPLPDGVTYTFDGPTRELKFFVEDGYIDTGDSFDIDFNVDVLEQCYFLETACSASFSIQATATFNGEINTTTQTTSSSGTLDECGFGNHDPSIVEIKQPKEVKWETGNNDLNVTIACDDTTALNNAQNLEPATEFCDFTLNKTSGAFVADPDCEAEGTYTNTWTFTDACGRVSETFTQVITLVDTTVPSFNEAVPADTVAAYDNIPSPETLTASDSCDSNPQVTFVEDYDGDETSTTYIILRTWTAADCAGNTTEHTQKIFVTENGDPIGLAINDISVDEDEGTATFTVTHTGEVPAGFTVNFTSADGTAIAPNDYTAFSDALSFSGDHGEAKTIDVTINDDIIIEAQEEYTMTLTTGTNTPVINKAIGTGTIVDNDAATISIADIDVNEAVGNATIVVTLNGSVEEAFDIDFTTVDGSAEAGTDYTTVASQINWPANATSGSTQNILVPINNDDLIEFTENFLVDLTNILASGDITFADNQANVNILDNDAIAGTGLSFDATSVTVDEAAGNASFIVRLSGNVQGGFTVDYDTTDGSAEVPGDYTNTSGTLTFAGTDGEFYTINVPVNDDSLIENTEDFFVDLSNISNILVLNNTPQATGNITDNDAVAGTGLSFDATSVTVDEAAGVATFTVTLTGDVQGGFTVDYATADGSAGEPGDYSNTFGTLTFVGTDGESFDIDVPIIDDTLIENPEDFFVDLSNLSTTLIGINTPQATGNITDNDAVAGTGLNFDATSVTVDEAAGVATFTVTLTGDVQGGFTVDYATADSSAGEPGDYTSTFGTLTFVGTDGESFDIDVPIIDDTLIENPEDFFVDLSNLSTTLIGINTPQATGNITDNDAVAGTGLSFDATSVTVDEAAGVATFTVTLTGDVQGGFTVDYATADGSAGEPGDYTSTFGTLTFVGTDGESFDIDVPIIDDTLIENPEDFFVDLSNLSTTLIGINTPQATGNITDNDAVAGTGLSFDATSVTVDEADGVATFTVTLTGDVQGGFTVDYATADSSAGEPGDYTSTFGTLTFVGTDGESFDIDVPIIDDTLIENPEDFFVDLSNLSTTLIGINTPQATGNITDNDAVAGTGLNFDATSVTVDEAAGVATFTVTLTGDVQGGFTVDYATADGSAGEPGDYTSTFGTLTFVGTDGESFDIDVPIIDDTLIENPEDFFVDLSNLSTTLIGINTPQATGNITDNDAVAGTGLSFDATSVTVDEAAGVATFTVTLTGDVQGGFTVDYATADSSAGEPGDYTSTFGTLTFVGTDGESFDIDVPIIDDTLIENPEDFFVDLSNLSTTLIGINTPQATGNITDNDAVAGTGLSFDATSVTVDEAAGVATFTVTLTGDVQGGFTVDYATADGSAGEPGDYTSTFGTLTFVGTDGESFDIDVPIIDDTLIENPEDFFVDLSNLSTTLIGINTPQATGNITDNDAVAGTGLSFDATSVTVDEAAGVATFTVTLTGDVQGGFTVDYATADGSAAQPGDYTSTFGTLTFVGTDGESFDIDVPIIDDVIIEAAEVFSIGLSNVSHSAININTPSATGTIIDNDSEDDFPSDTTMQCEEIPVLDDIIYIGEGEINLNASDCEYVQEYTEVITGQDDECATEYTITRTWTITDCVDNVRTHTQIITVLDTTAPVFVETLPADMTVSCDAVPTPAEMTAMDNCDADASVTFTEIITGQDDECASEYTITRTWVAQDCAGNSTTHTQTIIVEDVIAPTFVEQLPADLTTTCSEVPAAATLTAIDNCDPNITVTFEETITNDTNCAMGYTITRTWMANDCAGNATAHTQVITIPATGPITASDYDEEAMITCGEDIPEVPNLTFMGGCGDYTVVFTEETQFSGETDDYMIIRTWEVTDACGNTKTFEQIIFVMQPQLETVTIDICVEDPSIDLVNYLPASFDTNGTFEIMTGGMVLNGSILDPIMVPVGEYQIAYSSTEGTCKYYVDFTITVNADCVPCGIDDIIPSKTVTPNGDGVNDVFEIKGVEFCNFNFDVMLFNRWGAKVYEAQNYQNDWGGSSPNNSFGNSGMLPAGTYYYIIKVTNKDFEPVSGYIYLGSN